VALNIVCFHTPFTNHLEHFINFNFNSSSRWVSYLTASGTPLALLVLCLFAGGQCLLLLTDWWLLVWASAKDQNQPHLLATYVALCLATVDELERLLLFSDF
jgi:hypothetical protein